MPKPGTCSKCGASIIWAKGVRADGTRGTIPLNKRRVRAYEIREDSFGPPEFMALAPPLVHISHFNTCPFANEFSGKGKKGELMPKHPDLDPTQGKDATIHPLAEKWIAARDAKAVADANYNQARDVLATAMHSAGRLVYFCDGVSIEGHEVFVIKGKKTKETTE